ncbi:TPA: helix-turn-helix transcriptional regulator [Escherichia coli]
MKKILIYSDNYYFRLGLTKIISDIPSYEGAEFFYGKDVSSLSVDFIFIDAAVITPITCLNFLSRINSNAFMFILTEKRPQYNRYILPCHLNTLTLKNYCFNEIIVQLTAISQLKKSKAGDTVSSICHNCAVCSNKISLQQEKVLELLAKGLTCTTIANRMNIHYKTVQTHKYRIMEKYKIKTKHELYTLLRYFT